MHIRLMTLLADALPHHVTELAQACACQPHQLNALWQSTPAHIRGLLRQKDGFWQLVRTLALLPEQFSHPDFGVQQISETASTNEDLLQQARNGANIHRQILVAQQQTAGRGRQGRNWYSRSGECLTFSLGWTFAQEQAGLGALALVCAHACQRALAALGCPAQIKWPNDLVVGTGKLGGILIETLRRDGQTHAVIGIGLNFVLPKAIEQAASFQAASHNRRPAAELFSVLLDALSADIGRFAEQGFVPFQAAYQAAHRDQDREVCLLQDGRILAEGRVAGVAEDGSLLLHTDSGIRRISSGETSLRLPEQIAAPVPTVQHHLLLDGGNSRLKWAWVENGRIVRTNSAPYRNLQPLADEWQQYGAQVSRIVGSAVCGPLKQQQAAAQVGLPVQWLGSQRQDMGLTNHYRHPEEHGADRWFNAIGSRRFSQNARIVLSCGTAVTIDALTADGHYLGGSIMPGFHLMRESLVQKTAKLQRSEGSRYPFPTTTANAMTTGIMDAVCGAMLLMHARLQERVGGSAVDVVLTGGGAAKVAAALPETFTQTHTIKIVDNLVMHGLLEWLAAHPDDDQENKGNPL